MKKVKIEFYFNKSTYVLKSMINIFNCIHSHEKTFIMIKICQK
jgi:hypothetical protein